MQKIIIIRAAIFDCDRSVRNQNIQWIFPQRSHGFQIPIGSKKRTNTHTASLFPNYPQTFRQTSQTE